MRIDKSYQRFDGRDVITDPNTPKSIPIIKLSKFLVEEIADYLECHSEIGFDDRMFPVIKCRISRAMKIELLSDLFRRHRRRRGKRQAREGRRANRRYGTRIVRLPCLGMISTSDPAETRVIRF